MASRELKDEEKSKLQGKAIALDGIAVIVNKENATEDLTMEQIQKIFTGGIHLAGKISKAGMSILCEKMALVVIFSLICGVKGESMEAKQFSKSGKKGPRSSLGSLRPCRS